MSNAVQGRYFEELEILAIFRHVIARTVNEIMEKRLSNSRPNACIVRYGHRGSNQRDTLITKISRTALAMRKPAGA